MVADDAPPPLTRQCDSHGAVYDQIISDYNSSRLHVHCIVAFVLALLCVEEAYRSVQITRAALGYAVGVAVLLGCIRCIHCRSAALTRSDLSRHDMLIMASDAVLKGFAIATCNRTTSSMNLQMAGSFLNAAFIMVQLHETWHAQLFLLYHSVVCAYILEFNFQIWLLLLGTCLIVSSTCHTSRAVVNVAESLELELQGKRQALTVAVQRGWESLAGGYDGMVQVVGGQVQWADLKFSKLFPQLKPGDRFRSAFVKDHWPVIDKLTSHAGSGCETRCMVVSRNVSDEEFDVELVVALLEPEKDDIGTILGVRQVGSARPARKASNMDMCRMPSIDEEESRDDGMSNLSTADDTSTGRSTEDSPLVKEESAISGFAFDMPAELTNWITSRSDSEDFNDQCSRLRSLGISPQRE